MNSIFTTKKVDFNMTGYSDEGIAVKKLLSLIKENDLYDQVYQLLDIDDILEDFIEVPGASRLVSDVLSKESGYIKFDLESNIHNVEFSPNDNYKSGLRFINIDDEKVLEIVENDEFAVMPMRSSLRSFFSSIYDMDKYASSLMKMNFHHIIKQNIDYLKQEGLDKSQVYRIIQDNSDDDPKYFLRAIVSNRYKNYDNRMTVALGLIGIHRQAQKNGDQFMVDRFELNESMIRVFYRQNVQRDFDKVGKVSYLLDVSNDEIKQGSLKFGSTLSIDYGKGKDKGHALYIKSKSKHYQLISIRHSLKPESAIQRMRELGSYRDNQDEVFEDIEIISKIKDPNQIVHLLKQKIEKATSDDINKYKTKISGALQQRVDSLYELLELLNKVELIAEDIEAKEYLRYLTYEVLIKRKK